MTPDSERGTATDTERAIMEATFRALSKHGYVDLRLRDIGDEFEMTRQLIHYYYDGKHDLISAFLEYVIEQYEGSVAVDEGDRVAVGDRLGAVGNSGNTTEPHLHIHAVDATKGMGVPISFDGRVPVRNRRFP